MKVDFILDERGESIVSVMVALLISAIVLSSSTGFFINSLRHSTDIRNFTEAQVQASSLLDLMSFELRILGSGMPLTQAEFTYEKPSIGELAHPILLSSSSSTITFRFNETGASATLTRDLIPLESNHTITLDDSSGLNLGDTVYISSFSSGGTHGLRGIVSAKDGNSILLENIITTPGAVFPANSLIQPVTEVTFSSTIDGTTRSSSGGGSFTLPQTTFELRYLDDSGSALSLPLTPTMIRDSLSGIEIVVRVQTNSRFDNSRLNTATRTIEARQSVALRNLIMSR